MLPHMRDCCISCFVRPDAGSEQNQEIVKNINGMVDVLSGEAEKMKSYI